MMKKICVGILLVLVLVLVSALAAGESTTLLVYLCGTDIQDAAVDDLFEMADVEAGDAIHIVILAGGAEEWDMEDLEGNTRTLTVLRDGYIEELEDWGFASMGAPESLKDFLVYGMTEYPSDRTIVILWNHGAGTEGGVCIDETADDDSLTLLELDQALLQAEKEVPNFHIDVFGCDACMMATYEMAVILSQHNIDYYIASEELEPETGWYYTGWMQKLGKNPSMTNAELCGLIVDSYVSESLRNKPDDYLTMSVVDLREMGPLRESMEDYALVLTREVEGGNLASVRRGRSRMYTFGSFDDGSWDMVDLGAALDTYAQFDPEKAATARKYLSKAVIINYQTDNLSKCSGLSILIPQDTLNEYDEYREGFQLTGTIPNWVQFLNTYVGRISGEHYQIAASGTSQITEGTFPGSGFVPSNASPYDSFWWDGDGESYIPEEDEGEEILISESDMGFTASLSPEDLANLDYVEGMLLMDISDEEVEGYVDLGSVRNNLVNWQTGTVVSLFDGTWPVLDGQLVPLYDQSSNESSRRSLIPVKVNDQYTYLVVVFEGGSNEGRILGSNAGYDENGLPIRNTKRLQDGDVIIPVYTVYYEEEGMEDLEEGEFEGEKIIWREGMTVRYEDIADEEEPTTMLFCFVFNDIFGDSTLSEMIEFEL